MSNWISAETQRLVVASGVETDGQGPLDPDDQRQLGSCGPLGGGEGIRSRLRQASADFVKRLSSGRLGQALASLRVRIPSSQTMFLLAGRILLAAQTVPLAEGKGFEPLDRVNGRRFSRPVLSTTQPPLRRGYSAYLVAGSY